MTADRSSRVVLSAPTLEPNELRALATSRSASCLLLEQRSPGPKARLHHRACSATVSERMSLRALIAVSLLLLAPAAATTDLGDGTQRWSEEPVTDHAYVQAKLREIAKTVSL